jgi:hypothetical protein
MTERGSAHSTPGASAVVGDRLRVALDMIGGLMGVTARRRQ